MSVKSSNDPLCEKACLVYLVDKNVSSPVDWIKNYELGMANYKISLACLHYDRTDAILRQRIKPEGIDLQVVELNDVRDGFLRMFRGEFDVSEFSLAEYVYYLSRAKCQFVGIPVFLNRRFRHSYIFCNTSSNVIGPESLIGKRIGFWEWVQTASVWIRGTLVEEYGISPKGSTWCVGSVHHWEDEENEEIKPQSEFAIRWLEKDRSSVEAALLEGEIDALVLPTIPKSFISGDKRLRRLFENYRAEERAYFEKTGIFPIMHLLVARKSVIEQHPELPEKLFKLFCDSKKWARERLRLDRGRLVWAIDYRREEDEIFQGDPWQYGLKSSHHVIEKFLSYCYEQGVSDRKLHPRQLFAPSTWDLSE